MCKFLVTCISIICLIQSSFATHILGGHMSYKTVSVNQDETEIELKLTLYRSTSSFGAPFDISIALGIYTSDNGNWNVHEVVHDIDLGEILMHNAGNLPFVVSEFIVDFESATYITNVILPNDIDQDYMISYQRCCRDNSINNILNPDETGFAMQLLITQEGLLQSNNSPSMFDVPPTVGVINVENTLQFPIEELDGDSLSYSFCSPHVSGGLEGSNGAGPPLYFGSCFSVGPNPNVCLPPYDNVDFLNDFSAEEPFGIQQLSQINSITGDISVSFNTPGIYTYGVCIDESREGALLSRMFIDHVIATDVFELVSIISGRPYHDLNQNGIKDIGEVYLEFIDVDLDSEYKQKLVNDQFGETTFSFYIEEGTYQYVLEDDSPWVITNDTMIVVDALGELYGADIGLIEQVPIEKIDIVLYNEVPVCDESIWVSTNLRNLGSQSFIGKIEMDFDSILEFVTLNGPHEQIASKILWDVDETKVGERSQYWANFIIPDAGFENQEILFEVNVYDTTGNLVLTEIIKDDIVCATPTNSKEILSGEDLSQNTVSLDQELEYMIRFHLDGFDSHNRVIVRDTLDENLDPKSLRVIGIGPSNFHSYSIIGQIVTFELLGFGGAQEGFIRYSVRVREGTPIGTEVSNTAIIYVDSNNPSVTNSTLTEVVEIVSTDDLDLNHNRLFQVSPNPSSGQIEMSYLDNSLNEITQNYKYELLDESSKMIVSGIMNTSNIELTSNLSVGVYFLIIKNTKEQVLQIEKIIVH